MKLKALCAILAGILMAACNTAPAPNAAAPNSNNTVTTKTDASKKSAPTDLKALAKSVVTQSAGVKEGEIVLVSGGARDMELLENIVIEVEKAGGQPLLSIDSDSRAKRSFAEVPEKYDSQEPKLGMALAKMINVSINVDSNEIEGLFADVPPTRLAARAKAGAPVNKEFLKNKVRSVSIGNDLYPTEWRAKRFEMPVDNYAKLFWEGVNIDYTSLQATGEKARSAMTGKEVEVTNPNGTSIKFNIEPKPAYISDGVISADDVVKGNTNVYLPAGESALIIAANSGTGKVVIDKDFFNAKEMHNVVLSFENGKLTSVTGEGDGFAPFKADLDARSDGKDVLSFLDIGINPSYTLAPTTKFGNWVSAGMVTIGTGNNSWAGGSNDSTGGVSGHVIGCTVKIDGKAVVENGALKL